VIALGAFVFHAPIVIPVLVVVSGGGADRTKRQRLSRLFTALLARACRRPPPSCRRRRSSPGRARAVLLAVATLCNLIGWAGSVDPDLLEAGAGSSRPRPACISAQW